MPLQEPPAYRAVVESLLSNPAVSEARMMGMPALKARGRLFGGLADGCLVVRIGRSRVDELVAMAHAEPFDPSGRGRPMRDWALVRQSPEGWESLAHEALTLLDA
ncbi:MAG: TfoX/Sxy family protein [Candidatus Dormibacteraeota bacterium]|uniref:TfoX/Sxy family protein n=1 Tax=Candidatus Dormibacter sp. TaxID=2973982 RepID=UPI0027EB1080|nr:TfoX/Sxy family protein [Candidatus Dormibacteraeota bacterium]